MGSRHQHELEQVESWGPLCDVPFLVYEFVNTATVEARVLGPSWGVLHPKYPA